MAKKSNIGFKELDVKLDRVIDAMDGMATKEDVRRLEGRIENVEKIQLDILHTLDTPATATEKLTLEYAAVSSQVSRHDRSINQIAHETGVKLAG